MNKFNKMDKFNNEIIEGKEVKKYEHKLGTGSLFKNKFKKTIKQPDINGQLRVSRVYMLGEIVKFSGWIHESENNKYYSLSENNHVSQPNVIEAIDIDLDS
jgi:hypothetical protein